MKRNSKLSSMLLCVGLVIF